MAVRRTSRRGRRAKPRHGRARLQTLAAYVPGMLYELVRHPDGRERFLYVGPAHGGTISAASEPRRGTTFRVEVPVAGEVA